MLLLKFALRPWSRAPGSQALSAIAVGILLVLTGLLFWLQQGLGPIVARLQHEQVITAYLDPAIDAKEAPQVANTIRDTLRVRVGAAAIREVTFVDANRFVDSLKKPYPELARELEDLGEELDSVVPRHVNVVGTLNDRALSEVRSVAGIESAETSKDRFQSVIGAFTALRWVAKALAVATLFALGLGLIHLARTNAHLHREALGLLRLAGTSGFTLRMPGLLSGLSVGAVGGAIGFVGWLVAGFALTRHVRTLSPLLADLPAPSPTTAASLLVIGALSGALSGLIADWVAPPATASRYR